MPWEADPLLGLKVTNDVFVSENMESRQCFGGNISSGRVALDRQFSPPPLVNYMIKLC